MTLIHSSHVPFEEYLKLREESEQLLEYIDGVICMSPSPSIKHQLVSSNLHTEFGIYLKGKKCRVFAAPTDIQLSSDEVEDKKIVIPDLSIICNERNFSGSKYVGVPTLIVEILSPSNQGHDLVTKFNLYMKYGVKEELLQLVSLRGIGRVRARRLWRSNIRTVAALQKIDQKDLARILGTGVAAKVKQAIGQKQAK